MPRIAIQAAAVLADLGEGDLRPLHSPLEGTGRRPVCDRKHRFGGIVRSLAVSGQVIEYRPDNTVHWNRTAVSILRLTDRDDAREHIDIAPTKPSLLGPSEPRVHAYGEQRTQTDGQGLMNGAFFLRGHVY